MIAFATAMTDPEAYRRYARPGIERAAEPDSELLAIAAVGSIARGYNLLLDIAQKFEQLEALVLVSQEVELGPGDVAATIRRELSDPTVAAVGCAGATDVHSLAWWEGSVYAADVMVEYNDYGGGRLPAYEFTDRSPAPATVEVLDGAVLALSPWAVRNVRFDEGLGLGHGFDLDYCLRLGEQGRKARVAEIPAILHRPLELADDRDVWVESHIQFSRKWEERVPGFGRRETDWKTRARMAEAEREAARTRAYSTASSMDAQALPLERRLEQLEATRSWRLTRPLRELRARRARPRR